MGPAALAAKATLDGGGRVVRNVTGGTGGTAFLVFFVLFGGWLFVSGRLPRVLRAIAGGPEVVNGVAIPGATPLPPGPGTAVPGGVTPAPPGNLNIPTLPPAGGMVAQFRLPDGRTARVAIMPGAPWCIADCARSLVALGVPPASATSWAQQACAAGRQPAGIPL